MVPIALVAESGCVNEHIMAERHISVPAMFLRRRTRMVSKVRNMQ